MGGGRAKRRRMRLESTTPGRLAGLKVALDVQHLWKPKPRDRDRGAIFVLPDGSHVAEADAALIYAGAAARWLCDRGAEVLENQPGQGIFVGTYRQRNFAAVAWGASCYLACHLDAGGGHYALFEAMSVTAGEGLAAVLARIPMAVPELGKGKTVALHSGERGAACIEHCGAVPAVICEPFFGDHPATQPLLALPGLVRVGEAIAMGVAAWWEGRRPVA